MSAVSFVHMQKRKLNKLQAKYHKKWKNEKFTQFLYDVRSSIFYHIISKRLWEMYDEGSTRNVSTADVVVVVFGRLNKSAIINHPNESNKQ